MSEVWGVLIHSGVVVGRVNRSGLSNSSVVIYFIR